VDMQGWRNGSRERAVKLGGFEYMRFGLGDDHRRTVGGPGELVVAAFDRAGDVVAAYLAFELAPFVAVGPDGGDVHLVAIDGSLQLQLVERAGEGGSVGLQLDPGCAKLVAEPHKVHIPLAGEVGGGSKQG